MGLLLDKCCAMDASKYNALEDAQSPRIRMNKNKILNNYNVHRQ